MMAIFLYSFSTAKRASIVPWKGSMKQMRAYQSLSSVTVGFVEVAVSAGISASANTSEPASVRPEE